MIEDARRQSRVNKQKAAHVVCMNRQWVIKILKREFEAANSRVTKLSLPQIQKRQLRVGVKLAIVQDACLY